MRIPDELGRPVRTHHPINPTLSVVLCALPGLLLGTGLAFGPVGSATIGANLFAFTTLLLIAFFAESLFVRQQLYEHGLLLSSVVPLTPRCVIPYATIAPDSIRADPYHRTAGAADVTDAFNRRYRQAPAVGGVTFVAITPRHARRLAKGRQRWHEVVSLRSTTFVAPHEVVSEQWFVGFRNNQAAAGTPAISYNAARGGHGDAGR